MPTEIKYDATEIKKQCDALEKAWGPRNDKVGKWYDILLMVDEFAQEGMESFVSNDPKTSYNMALHMLCDEIPHRIPTDNIDTKLINDASAVEDMIERAWRSVHDRNRLAGRQGWLREHASNILATGWYSVFAFVDQTGFYADIWNPVEVYPDWDDRGLIKCARKYVIAKLSIMRKVLVNGWKYDGEPNKDETLYNFWWIEDAKPGATPQVMNAVVIGDQLVKPPTAEPFSRIPIFISPVGGLPYKGSIKKDDTWRERVGESYVAANEVVYRQYNKQWTFSSQLLRDTAQPRWFEQSRDGNILSKENMFKRGAIFKGGPEDKISAVPMPPMPIELRTDRIDIQGMLQRGNLPWSLSGDLSGAISGYMMSQVAASAKQILQSYHQAIKDSMTDIDNFWMKLVMEHSFNPFEIKLPKIDPSFEMVADYSIKVPGDVVQRATVARMICPDFRLSKSTTMDLLFPEIKNPIKEDALARKDAALSSEMAIKINLIAAFRSNAIELRELKDTVQADLYDKAADLMEQELSPQQPLPQGQMPGQPSQKQASSQAAPQQQLNGGVPQELANMV
jgi:hypothetical protein